MSADPTPKTESDKRHEEGLSSGGQKALEAKLEATCGVLLALLIGGAAVTAVQVRGNPGAAIIWALAFLAIGSIGGFLFAIPRVPRTSRPSKDANSRATLSPTSEPESADSRGFGLGINTNLVEISDWLTKILVGVGLVQLRALPDYIRRIGNYVGQGLGQDQQVMASGIVIYFSGLGFLSGYLLTRMFVGPAFRLADQATTSGLEEKLEQARALVVEAETISQKSKAIAQQSQAISQESVAKALESVAQTEINADVETAIEELKKDEADRPPARMSQLLRKLESHRRKNPLHRKLNIVLARVYREGKGDVDSAIKVLQDFIEAKERANQANDRDTADAYFNIACYYSQQLQGATGAMRDELEEKGLGALEKSLEILPENVEDIDRDKDLTELRKSPRVIELVRTVSEKLPKSNA